MPMRAKDERLQILLVHLHAPSGEPVAFPHDAAIHINVLAMLCAHG